MEKLLIHAWVVHKQNGKYFLPYTHWIYLQQIVKYYSHICLISPVKKIADGGDDKLFSLEEFTNLSVYELPNSNYSYAGAIKHIGSYYNAYKRLHKHFDKVYVRYPVPFGWLSKLFFKDADRTIHFVGYPLEVTKLNPELSTFKKNLLLFLFRPEHSLYVWACKGAKVFTNGHHIKENLCKQGVNATAVISSTLVESDFYFDEYKQIDTANVKLLHIGYLRKWKNIDVIIKAFKLLLADKPGATLTIVGEGECKEQLKSLAVQLQIADKVDFKPHASRRDELTGYLRTHDIFCFSSISEGSPRVILEAMANGINVLSSRVGSLPFIFTHKVDIAFADNNEQDFYNKLIKITADAGLMASIRANAFDKAQQFTIAAFIRTIFNQVPVAEEQPVYEI
ncbi:glycosyltransferase [Mucilaginibacter limnophilus]|uniref:Glycosyltransferase n=1 Tax=Mucilaginibacter limnophilus TaxID=1932778 RepID=A0A3S2V1I4_9SPHI|nr:glycosyltransferase [Mucilaginibacter limnophilus]RVU00726.1 glycosyltransferase [Mucilaginibacter limnophilus]